MRSTLILLLTTVWLAACDGNPFVEVDPVDPTDPDDNGGITTEGGLPPGTTSPTPGSSITRYEPKDGNGNGFVTNVHYDGATDTFKVDNLAFDGDSAYTRGVKVPSLSSGGSNTVAVFEGPATAKDPTTGNPIDQLDHRALYGVSADGTVKFAIVRTGSYVDYGFGGFIYQRAGGVTLPAEGAGQDATRGQAHYAGKSSSLRDHDGRGGLEYGTADMTMDIDFDDFNDGNGVSGQVYNRRIFDAEGNDITQDIIAALSTESGNTMTDLPVIRFVVGPGVMNDNGEIVGLLSSNYYKGTGAVESFEQGKYYALVSGSNAEKVVGVFVVEGDDPRWDGVTTRETGGFILDR